MQIKYIPLFLMAFILSSCGGNSDPESDTTQSTESETTGSELSESPSTDDLASGPTVGSLQWAIEGDWRDNDIDRDLYRHPAETLEFFNVDPSSTIVEVWPGAGWYSAILAPWVTANNGTLIAAHVPADTEARQTVINSYEARFADDAFAAIEMSTFQEGDLPVEPDSVDTILTFRNIHNWMAGGYAETALESFYSALKPGGTLGLVAHRLPASVEQDPRAANGYVQEDYVIALAQEAGFELVGRSGINANPADTTDHPFGVWSLPPNLRSSPSGEPENPEFDTSPYAAIGESDRMTLLFRKPGPEPEEVIEVDSEDGEPIESETETEG